MISSLHGQALYDFGNPTGEEQLYLELINRARANPAAEGARLATTTDSGVLNAYSYFGVSLALMQSEFSAIPAQPPLAPNASLTNSARGHSAWMLATGIQAHYQTNPSNSPSSRAVAAGYGSSYVGENIYASASSTWYGHAGFQVDWGYGSGGMQTGRGHRMNIHSPDFREIGVGVQLGSSSGVGPQLVTQDFGYNPASPCFGTGVAYYDLNGNNFYDVGEGISGLTVHVSGASHYCITAEGGGWAIPVPSSAATRTVTFSGPGLDQTKNLVIPASNNGKTDLKLSYSPPAITSSTNAYSGIPHPLTFAGVSGATGYKWDRWNLSSAPAENCESTAGITSSTTGTYSVRSTSVKQQGGSSFHLENSTGASQSIELNGLYFGQSSPSLSFQSRVRYATTAETFKVQVKEEGGTLWQNVYSQTGTSASGESSFSLRTAALTAMTGKAFRIRFLLNHSGSFFSGYTGDLFGWFIDAVSFTNVSELSNPATTLLAGTSASFTPLATDYLMSVSPMVSSTLFPASYQLLTVSDPPPTPEPSFTIWAEDFETSASLPAGAISDPNGDYDHDGRTNLIEYAFGTSPVSGNDSPATLPTASTTDTHFVLRYQCDTSLTDLTYTPQSCPIMENWKAPGETGAPAGFTDELVSSAGSIQTREAKIPRSATTCFLRVRVSRQ